MGSEKSKRYWEKLSKNISNPNETTNKRTTDYIDVDVAFVKRFMNIDDTLLDMGSGSGLVINNLVNNVKEITAVETFEGLTQFIDDEIFVINADLKGFKIRKKYNKITCTGVSQYFTEKEITGIYQNMFSMLEEGGKLIMRVHCGLDEKVIINGFSKELSSDYFTEYRHLQSEIKLLKRIGFNTVEVFDEVSDILNVWKNTRHFYFVCAK